MKYAVRLALILFVIPCCAIVARSQSPASAEQSVANLRTQLQDLERKQEELQTRLRQLDEDLKPENIEKYFALSGSTHPEELREQRRRQLETEKANVQSQLDQLTTSRARLEASIAAAEAAAYRQSAYAGPATQPTVSNTTTPAASKKSARRTRNSRARRSKRRG